jgi:hypothetical protein
VAAPFKIAGDEGVTAIEVKVALTSFKVTAWLVIPDKEAVMLVVPVAEPLPKPAEDIEATVVLELAQVTTS